MSTKKVELSSLIEFLERIGFRFRVDSIFVPADFRNLEKLLVPYHPEFIREMRRRNRIKAKKKPIKRILRREEVTERDSWTLEAHCNAMFATQEIEALDVGSNPAQIRRHKRFCELAKDSFVTGFMLAVDLLAAEYGIDLDQVPEQN